jgi:hypothetical protein
MAEEDIKEEIRIEQDTVVLNATENNKIRYNGVE